jgi:hypothetical protein
MGGRSWEGSCFFFLEDGVEVGRGLGVAGGAWLQDFLMFGLGLGIFGDVLGEAGVHFGGMPAQRLCFCEGSAAIPANMPLAGIGRAQGRRVRAPPILHALLDLGDIFFPLVQQLMESFALLAEAIVEEQVEDALVEGTIEKYPWVQLDGILGEYVVLGEAGDADGCGAGLHSKLV